MTRTLSSSYRAMDAKQARRWDRQAESKHPVGRSSWRNFRLKHDYWVNWPDPPELCQWCGEKIDNHDHEDIWDHIRIYKYPSGKSNNLSVPSWFPTWVCSTCSTFLTPYLFTLVDIGMLNLYVGKLDGVIRYARQHDISDRERFEVNWPIAHNAGECC